jgi:nudix-type nucleoside diphosphatase (YffH/AdpP family)
MPHDETINVTEVVQLSDNWNRLDKVTFDYRRKDGVIQSLTREVYHVDDGATVLLYDELRRTVLLIRQFRLPMYLHGGQGYLIEAPAGLLGDADAAERIKAEIEEETGYRVATVRKIFEAVMMPGCAGHKVHFFMASYSPSDKVSDGGGLEEEGEDIEVLELGIDDALSMVDCGEIVDAKTIMLLQYAKVHLVQTAASHG